MNKIDKKVLNGIDKSKDFFDTKEFFGTISLFEYVVNEEYSISPLKPTKGYIQNYKLVEKFLFNVCNLSEIECGIILDKVLKYNSSLTFNEEAQLIDPQIFKDKGIDEDKWSFLVISYMYNPSLLTIEESTLITSIMQENDTIQNALKNTHKDIQTIINSKTYLHDNYHALIYNLKKLNITDKLIESYVIYLKSKEKKMVTKKAKVREQKNTQVISQEKITVKSERGKWKKLLNELYHPQQQDEYFDLKDIKKFLKLTKLLCIADSRVAIILNDIYNHALKNDNYYKYLIEKARYMNKYTKELEDISDYHALLTDSDYETKLEIQEILNELYKIIEPILTKSFKYEEELVKKL